MTLKCPGMDPAFFKFEDIREFKCPHCGGLIEFWKNDVRLKCGHCGMDNFNPTIESSCLSYCKEAVKCLGDKSIEQWRETHTNIKQGGTHAGT